VRFGLIPEFVGRFPTAVSLEQLSKEQLVNILTGVKHNFVEQYIWLFDQDGVELEFDTESLDLIAERTISTKTGARGLHSELERVLLPHMFDLSQYRKQNIIKVVINKDQVNIPKTLAQENK
jgi:ATP-dependent Clp protease ATP-binding subunit ClpX